MHDAMEFEDLIYEPKFYDVTLWKDVLLRAGSDKNRVNLMRLSDLQREMFAVFVNKKMSSDEIAALGAESEDSDMTSDSEFEMIDEGDEDSDDDGYAYVDEKKLN